MPNQNHPNQAPHKDPSKDPQKHVNPARDKDQVTGDGNQDVLPGQHGNDSLPDNKQKKQDDRLKHH